MNLRLEGTYAGLGTITEFGCVMIVIVILFFVADSEQF